MARSLRGELAARSSHDFQSFFATILAELMEGSAETKRLGRFDRMGIDAFILSSNEHAILAAIQCKGFEVLDYSIDQQKQCRKEIAKFKAKGPKAEEYWLVVNRPIKNSAMRDELQRELADLVQTGKVHKTELLDLEPLVIRLHELAKARLFAWAEIKRLELFEYYKSRMQFVRYISDVPFNGHRIDPTAHILNRLNEFFDGLDENQTGKYRHVPRILITSEFGFGKTSTLQAVAARWIDSGKHLVYVPAALLGHAAFKNASGLADALLEFLVPEGAELSEFALQEFRNTLRDTLGKSKNWLVLIDALDESAFSFRANGLAALWSSINRLGIPAVLSARDEMVDVRHKEFFPDPSLKNAPSFERLRLNDWSDPLILEFVDRFRATQPGDEPPNYRTFRQLIVSKRYNEIYGDIPKRPLFLGMLADDAWSGNEPTRHLHRLYGKYFRKKFDLDRVSLAASGVQARPSAIVDFFGQDEAIEKLIHVMQDAADLILQTTGLSGSAIHDDAINETQLRDIASKHGIPFAQIEDVAMHSLLQPSGRNPVTRQRILRFAHRSFLEWFLARQFAEQGQHLYRTLPEPTRRFLSAMRADIAAGRPLP